VTNRWAKLTINATPRNLQRHGPNLAVAIHSVDTGGDGQCFERLPAIVDTGAATSGISPRLADKLKSTRGERNVTTVLGRIEAAPTLRCKLVYENGLEVTSDFSVLPFIDDYDVLIGCDLLK
jgi:gag-polyprotein putative aspartyl protease